MAQDNWWKNAPIVAPVGGGSGPLPSPPDKPKEPKEPKTSYRTLTSEEAASRGLPAGKVYQESSEGKIDALAGAGENPGDSKEVMRGANLDSIIGQINRVQELYDSGVRDETLWNGFGALDSIGPKAGQFDAAGQAIADQGLAAFRVPGVGAQSDMEAKQFALANTPQSGNWDAAIEEKLRTMRARVDANRKAMGLPPAQWAGTDQQPVVPPGGTEPAGAGGTPPSPGLSGGGETLEAAGETRRVPVDDALSAQADGMVRQGVPLGQINSFLQQQGRQPISASQYTEWRQFLKRHPDYPGAITQSYAEEKVTPAERIITTIGDNPVGAYAINAGQFLSGNTLDNMADDPERARQGIDFVSARNPLAAAAGQISGGVMGAMTGEAGLARLGMSSGLARGLLADAATGAANGAGMADDGDRGMGALQGGAASVVGSLAGQGVMRGASKALAPTGGRLEELYTAGVRPTVGQRMANANDGKGFTGTVGKVVNATEEALQSVPLVGSAIRGAREEARDQFQVGAFNESLKEIGEQLPKDVGPGTKAHAFTQKAFNDVYEKARSGMTMVADEELSNDLGQLAPDIATLGPQAQSKMKAILANSVNNKVRDGQMTGAGYKNAQSDLGKHIARLGKSSMAEDQHLAEVLTGVQRAIDAAARRHSSPEAVALLDAADAGYAKLVRIEEAASRRGGDMGTFSPANFDSAVQKTSGGVRSKAYLRGDANMQDYAAAGRSLEDRMPNSGSADRAAVATAAAGGAAYLEPTTLGVLGAIGAAYAPGIRKVVKGAMAPSGPGAKAIAHQLKKRARLAGAAGAATAVATLPGTAPAQ